MIIIAFLDSVPNCYNKSMSNPPENYSSALEVLRQSSPVSRVWLAATALPGAVAAGLGVASFAPGHFDSMYASPDQQHAAAAQSEHLLHYAGMSAWTCVAVLALWGVAELVGSFRPSRREADAAPEQAVPGDIVPLPSQLYAGTAAQNRAA